MLNTVVIETNQSTHDRQQCLICGIQSESKEFNRSDLNGVVDMSSILNNQREIGFDFDAVSSKNNGPSLEQFRLQERQQVSNFHE